MQPVKLAAGYAVVAVAFFLLGRFTAPGNADGPRPKPSEAPTRAPDKKVALKKVVTAHGPPQAPHGIANDPSPSIGPPDAPVIVLEVLDFQCPVCKRAYFPMKQLVQDLQGKVRLVFKHNPLRMHRYALDAAAAAMAAARQGKFWEYADILFQNQSALRPDDLERYARQLGLDMERFRKDFRDQALRARARAEGDAASQLGARGTPSFFINGKMQVGWASYPSIVQQVRAELQRVEELVARGVPLKEARKQRVRQNLSAADRFLASVLGSEYREP